MMKDYVGYLSFLRVSNYYHLVPEWKVTILYIMHQGKQFLVRLIGPICFGPIDDRYK